MVFFSKRWVMTTCLCLISVLHGLIFSTAQEAVRFFSETTDALFQMHKGVLSLPLYFSATIFALLTQRFCRLWGIKRVLVLGLVSNFIGIAFFLLTNRFGGFFTLAAGMVALGGAIASVATLLSTYVAVEFPKVVALGLIVLYTCFNFGVQISRPLFLYFSEVGIRHLYLTGLGIVMVFFIGIIQQYFVPEQIPKRLDAFRKWNYIWKELHSRFGIFIIAMILYGLIENTFNLLGPLYLAGFIPPVEALRAVFFFWMALNLGKIAIGLPAFWLLPSKMMQILPFFILTALILIPFQQMGSEFTLAFTIGGLGCSACFQLLIAMIVVDLHALKTKEAEELMIPCIESACGYMVAAYMFGVGIISLQNEWMRGAPSDLFLLNFKIAAGFALLLLILVWYLAKTRPKTHNLR